MGETLTLTLCLGPWQLLTSHLFPDLASANGDLSWGAGQGLPSEASPVALPS